VNVLDNTIKPDLRIKKTTFIFGQACLIIKQKKWFFNKEIKRIKYNNIQRIDLIEARLEKSFVFFILTFISEFFIPNNIGMFSLFNRHILINYIEGIDEAVFRLDINISKKELKNLKEILKAIKDLNH
jgi:hypothetical protein